MIGSLGLGLLGMGVVFIWAGVKDKKVGDFFAQLRGPAGAGSAPAPAGPPPTAPAAYQLAPGVAGPILPPAPALR